MRYFLLRETAQNSGLFARTDEEYTGGDGNGAAAHASRLLFETGCRHAVEIVEPQNPAAGSAPTTAEPEPPAAAHTS